VVLVCVLFPLVHHESIRHAVISAPREMPISFIPYTAIYGPVSLPGVICQLWLDGADATTLDYVFVRNYVSPEPSVTIWGALNTS